MNFKTQLISQLRRLPQEPGVYLFKNAEGLLVYVGKAKNLKKRGAQYIQGLGDDLKIDTIFSQSVTVECMVTSSELEALLLEAKLVQSHQPPCNVLLKTGQPFLYLFVPTSSDLPQLLMVRNQRQKGTYFGPFLEKGSARKVYDFLIKTFRLKICGKHIANGCLFYHLGQCAGSCRLDFDKAAYLERLELAKQALRQGHKKFLQQLQDEIQVSNKLMTFERSRELHCYLQAFEKVFYSLDQKPTDIEHIAGKHVWVLSEDKTSLWIFVERDAVLKKKRVFYFALDQQIDSELLGEYFTSFYTVYVPPATILTNIDFGDQAEVYEQFCKTWHHREYAISLMLPTQGHFAHVVRLACVQVEQELLKQRSLGQQLKVLFKLDYEPKTIDCFDISHKQGTFMVGSCVRFEDGQVVKDKLRKFHIKTVYQIDDYASLREIVARRYKDQTELPDLILIDGGKGQLNAVQDLFPQASFVCLAKREETVFSKRIPEGKKLDPKNYVGQMLIALRDYAHHFAITFHRSLENVDQ
ncbi:excinuclease ABC subunit C [Candidatus Dependentiae bacterium]|nr:excinuclease ABC subunit C [Candidatus Dependentiae bacterium]